MKIYKEKGSKERLIEMMQKVNKVKLNEVMGQGYDPQNVLAMAFDDLKNKRLNMKHTSTQAENDVSYVELVTTDKNGNDITFTFKAIVNEGDQEGVFDIADIGLENFTFDPSTGGESVEISGDMLKRFNLQHKNEMLDVVKEYMDVNDETSGTEDSLYEDAIRLIDTVPYRGGSERMVTHKQYADQKPTNDALRVKAPELDKFVNETKYTPETRKNIIDYFARIWSKDPILRTNPKFVEALGKYLAYTWDDFNKLSDDELQYIWDKSDEISNLSEAFGPEEKNLMNREISRFRNVIKPKDVAEPEPEEPAGDVPEDKKQMILAAYDNIVKRSGNPNYAPTTQEIQAELKKMSGVAPEPPKRTYPSMAEPFLENSNLGGNADALVNMQYANASPETKEMIIKIAADKVDLDLGVKKFQMPKQEYFNLIKTEAMKLFAFGLSKMNEDVEDYPKEMGKEFSPEKQYDKKKKKYSKKIKLKEEEAVADKGTGRNLNIGDVVTVDGLGGEYQVGVVHSEGKPFLMPFDMQKKEANPQHKIYLTSLNNPRLTKVLDYSETQGGFMSESEEDDVEKPQPSTDQDLDLNKGGENVETPEQKDDDIAQLAQDKEKVGDMIQGGKADDKSPLDFDLDQLEKGVDVEMEHTDNPLLAFEIAMDHLTENPEYYTVKDTPEDSAQVGAASDAVGQDGEKSEEPENKEGDDEMTNMLLGFKPMNVGDGMEDDEEHEEGETPEEEKKEGDLDEEIQVNSLSAYNKALEDFFAKDAVLNTKANLPAKILKVPFETFKRFLNNEKFRKSLMPFVKIIQDDIEESKESDLKQRDPATWHQIQIAKKTIRMPDAMANVMGGMTKDQAREILKKRGISFNEGSYDTSSIEENDDPYEKFKKYQEKDVKSLRDGEKEEYFNLWQQFKDVK